MSNDETNSNPDTRTLREQHWQALRERRGLLTTRDNPSAKLDYLVTVTTAITTTLTAMGKPDDDPLAAAVAVRLRYVPDRMLLARASLDTYFGRLASRPWPDLESLGVVAMEDLNSELIPRWLHLTLAITIGGGEHAVTLEDRQPRWDNAKLLQRLESI